MLRKIIKLLLPAVVALTGCIREDTGQCAGGFRLQLSYTYNTQDEDLLSESVGDIRIYIFDQDTGLLVAIIEPDDQDIARGYVNADLPDGTYTVIAWGADTDLTQGGYLDAEMTSPSTQTFTTPVVIGETTLDQFRMMLATTAGTPTVEDFDDLFYAAATDLEARRGTQQTVELDFIKNTCVLKVGIAGLEYLSTYTPGRAPGAGQPLEVFVTAKNTVYTYNNQIDAYAPEIRYEPPYRSLTASRMEVDIKIQRIEIVRHSADQMLLYVRDITTGMDLVLPIDVLEAVMKTYTTQSAIDRQEEFPFEISILHDLSVSVTVNGFVIVEATPEIGRP